LKKEISIMALTKDQIVDSIADQIGFPRNHSSEILETIIEIIKKSLESGEDVMISNFGKFCLKEKGQRRGRNPATGEDMILKSRKVVTFKCSGTLRNKINEQ
jgi:integration host factor subunit alpha